MKLTQRSTIVTVVCAGLLASAATPAAAIVGGRTATQSYPGVVSAQISLPEGTALCGAALIRPQWVLTAAHCVSDEAAAPTPVTVPASTITVRVGSSDRTSGGQVVTGRQVYLHPGWAWGTNEPSQPVADLALVELTQPVRAGLLPIALRQPPKGSSVRAVGWGLTIFPPEPGTTPPAMLQEIDTRLLPTTACAGGFAGPGEICTGGGPCYGDSGSPLLRTTPGLSPHARPTWVSVGIVSRGSSDTDPCGATDSGVYTDPTYPPFRRWIDTTILTRMVKPCTCPPKPTAARDELLNLFKRDQ